jgi:hypothetical protein
MISSLYRRLVLMVLSAGVVGIAPAEAQRAWEWQALALATLADRDFIGGGLGFGYRTDGRMRLEVLANVGDREGQVAFRPEAILSFHLNPYKRRGVSPYAGGGVAFVFNEGANAQYLVATLGLEWQPGAKWGWFIEAGLGGGLRLAGGVQLRKRRRQS